MAAALADDARQFFLAVGEFVDQTLIAFGLFQRCQILPLDIFDNAGLERFPVGQIMNDSRYLVQPGALGGQPAALAGDQFPIARLLGVRPDEDWLKYALFSYRG